MTRDIFFDSRTDNREDWDFALQLAARGCVPGWVREPLFVYRVRSDNSNASRRSRVKTLYSTFFVVQKHTDAFVRNDMKPALGDHYFGLARRFWREKRDVRKFLLCMARNIRYKGLADVFSLLRRKSAPRERA